MPTGEQAAAACSQGRIACTDERGAHQATFVPMHYEPNYGYPLLIWLHGPRDDERQLQRIMPLVSLRNYVAIAPRGKVARQGASKQAADKQAEDQQGADQQDDCWSQSERAIAQTEQTVYDCIDRANKRFNIDPRRVFLAGLQDGGTMALRVGLRSPSRFAGLLTIGGPFPQGNTPLLHLAEVRRVPLFLAQGRDSVKYPVDTACDELRLFHAAGLNVTLRQYPGGDGLTAQMLHDLDRWIMEQITGQSSTPPDEPTPPREEAN
jgi:phospholipase/carboxylesterase